MVFLLKRMFKQQKKLDIEKMISTSLLSYKTKEVIDDIEVYKALNPTNHIVDGERTIWLKPNKPDIIDTIAEDIKTSFKIDSDNYVFMIYNQPKKIDGKYLKESLDIINPNKKVLRRVMISTIDEIVDISISEFVQVTDKIRIKAWEAFVAAPFFSSLIDYKFNNTPGDKLEAKKGFRPTIIKKDPSKRFVLIFDFLEKKEESKEEDQTEEDFSSLVENF